MKEVSRAAQLVVLLLVSTVATGCSGGAPAAFMLKSASVDSPYACPASANNAPYALQAAIEVRNGTSSIVTIKSVAAQMTLAATKGSWLQKVGDKYEAPALNFSPGAVGAGSSSSLQVAIPSTCTGGSKPGDGSNYGEYSVELTVVTSSGTHKITSKNRHRILAG